MLAKKVTFNIDDPELRQWSHANQFAWMLAIKKKINKTEHHNKERGFVYDESHDDG